jgi:hypothetical protein
MQRLLSFAIVLFSLAAAHAQTNGQVNGQPSDSGSGVASDTFIGPTSPSPGSTVVMGGALNGQTNSNGSGVASDPLSVPTSPLPSSPGSAVVVGGAQTGSTTVATGTGGGTGATASITAPASTNPQLPLLLPGEVASTSTQTAKVMTRGAGTASSTICAPPVPSTDGGSANLSEVFGAPSGC